MTLGRQRDRKWRARMYLRWWLIMLAITFVLGWLSDGFHGGVRAAGLGTLLFAPILAVWEYSERRRDREYTDRRPLN
jgi:hypothetical protein